MARHRILATGVVVNVADGKTVPGSEPVDEKSSAAKASKTTAKSSKK